MSTMFPTPHTGSPDEDAAVSQIHLLLADVGEDEESIPTFLTPVLTRCSTPHSRKLRCWECG